MQMVWKKKSNKRPISSCFAGLPFEPASPEPQESENKRNRATTVEEEVSGRRGEEDSSTSAAQLRSDGDGKVEQLAQRLQEDGNALAEEGKYVEALGKWEAAIVLTAGNAVLHEQKSQVLMELGRTWMAVQSATRATELQPSWAEAWVTLSRTQLNYGEPALAVISSRTALRLKPGYEDAQIAFETAQRMAIKQRHLSYVGVAAATRLAVGGIQSLDAGNTRRAVVVDGDNDLPENGNSKDQVTAPADANINTELHSNVKLEGSNTRRDAGDEQHEVATKSPRSGELHVEEIEATAKDLQESSVV